MVPQNQFLHRAFSEISRRKTRGNTEYIFIIEYTAIPYALDTAVVNRISLIDIVCIDYMILGVPVVNVIAGVESIYKYSIERK